MKINRCKRNGHSAGLEQQLRQADEMARVTERILEKSTAEMQERIQQIEDKVLRGGEDLAELEKKEKHRCKE